VRLFSRQLSYLNTFAGTYIICLDLYFWAMLIFSVILSWLAPGALITLALLLVENYSGPFVIDLSAVSFLQ